MARDLRGILPLRTPEGLDLRIELAPFWRRFVAIFIDITIIYFVMLAMLIATAALSTVSDEWAFAAFFFGSFLFRNFYFAGLELIWSGRTVGKRILGLRVVDVQGRPLTATAVFLRNVTRDLEIFLPLIAIFAPETIFTGAPWWMGFFAFGWVFVFSFFPFFNRHRARAGDLIAGTTVALIPTPDLLSDIAETRPVRELAFSPQQLDMYGIYELQTLESVIRADLDWHELKRIADTIATKIDWPEHRIGEPHTFLDAFYAALRERLEHRMLLGDRQERKVEGRLGDDD
mgnify:CR=1 FL=1